MHLAYACTDYVEWDPSRDEGIWGKVWKRAQVVQQTGTFASPRDGNSAGRVPGRCLRVLSRRWALGGGRWYGAEVLDSCRFTGACDAVRPSV